MLVCPISKLNTKRFFATMLILAIVLSMSGLIVPISADIPQGNNVSWQSQDQTTQNSYDWTNQGWQFGPYPSFSIILPNGTEITNDNYIPLNQPFTVRIDVQKSVFIGNATLGQAGLSWNSQLRSENGTITGNADCKLMYVNNIQQGNWNQTNVWNINSNINNQTATPIQGPPMQFQPQNGFYQFNPQLSNITETDMGWRVQFFGAFNSTAPVGPYWVNLQISDQYNNMIDVNSQTGQVTVSNNRQIAVGQAGFVFGGLQDYWTFEKLDMQNNQLLSVSKGAKFKMQLNVTSSQFSNATIGLNIPMNIQQYVNVTGWYQKVVTEQGGWMYDDSAGNYYWNNTVQVTRNQQVWGPHLEQRWISAPNNNRQITIQNKMWNPVTTRDELTTQQIWVQDQLIMIFNNATQSFDLKQGYSYSAYDATSQQQVQYSVLNPINASDPASQFFTLSLSDCTYQQTGPNNYVVEFVGSFSNTTDYSQDQYNLQLNVFAGGRQIWANWQNTDQSDMQIIVDRPVAVSTILDAQGRPVTSQSMFMIGQNKPFIVQSKIYGGSEIYQSLDAVGVSFSSNFGSWSENQSSNSQVEIRLVKDLTTGQIASTSYNRTNVNRYVYGPHQGWAYVNVTDWHTEYNSVTSMWDWIESPHLIWNQTTLNDWHWEYSRFNQTEYARNPNSQNVWIDTTTCYVPDTDPAFQVPSYADLNSANISLVSGVVTVNLGVTFKSAAPQGNYWYSMIFQNMTYGQDPSKGWGLHQITEWTSQPTYFINGTSGQTWLVSPPSNPLYTTYNANRYQINQVPYVTIAGDNLLLKPQVQYDQARQTDWTQYLLTGSYDPSIGRQTQYYQLPNGTKLYVNQAYQTIIRSLQLTTVNAYVLVDGSTVALPNGTALDTYMSHAVPDYSRQQPGYAVPYYYDLLNGSRVYLNGLFEDSSFNSTTNHWDKTNQVYSESDTTLLVQSAGSGVKIGESIVLLRDPGYWQALPDGSGYYLVATNGTRITIKNYSVPDNQRTVTINGVTCLIGWPNQYYQAIYQGQTLLIPINGQNNDNYVQSYFYTDLGVVGGTKYELPYPGAMATSLWDLQGIESQGQKLRTFKSISIEGSDYLLKLDATSQSYYIDIDGSRQFVAYPTVDYNSFYSNVNGQANWNVKQNGWTINFGTCSQQSGQLTALGSLVTTTGYDSTQKSWTANRYGYDYENATLYLVMPNGTRLDVSSTMNLIVWRVHVGSETYYTTDMGASIESAIDTSGQTVFRNYFRTLDNTRVYFDWSTPANWEQEIHIPISGSNYTRLIPYTLQPQTVFDKIVLYNITIPAMTGYPNQSGVYFRNGIEVPVDTAFKVIGSTYGPGTCYNFNQNGNSYSFEGAYMPQTKAPWNNNLTAWYFITLQGEQIYSLSQFGWNGNAWNTEKQWQLNGDQASANQTVAVIQSGYAIYLNGTKKVDVTTANVCGGGTSSYLVLTNGTRIDVQWVPSLDQSIQWSTMIGSQRYVFSNVLTYTNLTDGGITYNIVDPLVFDQRHLYTGSTYQAPTISTDSSTWVRMNTTTESMLKDTIGFYLVNAVNQSRLDLQLVDNWWNVSSILKSQVFTNQYSNYYPRYSVAIDGVNYFVLDPSPVVDNWNGEWSTQQAMYRYPNTVDVTIGGATYTIALFQNEFSWNGNLTIRQINTINLNGQSFDIDDQYNWKPSYQVTIDGEDMPIQMSTMNIYQTHESQGSIYAWRLTDLGVSTTSSISSLIVGTPQYGMWGIKAYKTVDTTGAIDVDGDPATTNDQYFVRKVHSGTDLRVQTEKRLQVDTIWNPDEAKVGDEIHLKAWMGQLQVKFTSQWNEQYIWYHASDMTGVSSQEMAQIKDVIVNSETQKANPGYWDIAYMVRNQSWADVLDQAKANNWDWISSNTNEWNWLWFGTDQNYNVNVISGDNMGNGGIDLKYEFAGLNLLNGTSQTHYFMPKSVGNITFVTPGQAFGNMDASGSMVLPLNAKIDFGVTYNDVKGTLFPYDAQRSMWGWWDRPIYGSDFNAPNLMNKPTAASIDKLAFDIHFAGTQTAGEYNSASMKIDQTVGNWQLPADVVDGREQNSSGIMVPLMGNDVLANRSLAINYYVTASTSMGWNVKDAAGSNVNNNGVTSSSRFDVASQLSNVKFASIQLGSIYDWGKPTSSTDELRTYNVTSQTTSIQNFQSSYQSDAGKSSTGFDISSSMYFLTQAFPRWDGYSIYNDPEVSVMVSKGTNPTSTPSPSQSPGQPTPPPTQSTTTPQPVSNPTNQPTNQQTPKPSVTPPIATPPSGTVVPRTTPAVPEMPSMTILIIAIVGAIAAIGSQLAVRMKERKAN